MLTASHRATLRTWTVGTSTSLIEPTLQDMNRCRDAGLHCAEIVLNPSDDLRLTTAEQMAAWAKDIALQIHSIHLPYGHRWDVSQLDVAGRKRAIADHRRLLAMTAHWGAKVAVIHPSYEPIEDAERQQRLRVCRDSMQQLAAAAKQHGMQLAVECLPRTCLGNTSAEIAFLIESDENIGVCCDVNHLFQETPEHFIRTIGRRIITVHMSDNDGADEKHWLPGTGVINWEAILATLVDTGYKGPFLFEARGIIHNTKLAPHHLQQWWQQMISA